MGLDEVKQGCGLRVDYLSLLGGEGVPSRSSLMSLEAWSPSSFKFLSIIRLRAAAARSSADCAHPMSASAAVPESRRPPRRAPSRARPHRSLSMRSTRFLPPGAAPDPSQRFHPTQSNCTTNTLHRLIHRSIETLRTR